MRRSRIAAEHMWDSEISNLCIQNIHLVLQSPDLRQELIHLRRFFFLSSMKFICSQQSSSFRLFTTNSPQFLNVHAIQRMILLIMSTFRRQFFKTFCGFPSELDTPIGLHDVTLSVVIQVDCWFSYICPIRISFIPNHPISLHFSLR